MKQAHRNQTKTKDDKITTNVKNKKDSRTEKRNGLVKKASFKDIGKLTTPKEQKKIETIHLNADLSILTSSKNQLLPDSNLPSTTHQSQPNSVRLTNKFKFGYNNPNEQNRIGVHNTNSLTNTEKIIKSRSKDARLKYEQPFVRKINIDVNDDLIRKRLYSAEKSTKLSFLNKEVYGIFSVKNKDTCIKSKRFEFSNFRNVQESMDNQLIQTISNCGTNLTVTGKSTLTKSLRSSFFADVRPRNPHQPGNIHAKSTVRKPLVSSEVTNKKPSVPPQNIIEHSQNMCIVRLNTQDSNTCMSNYLVTKPPCENKGSPIKTISPKKKVLQLIDLEDDASPRRTRMLDPKYVLAKYSKYLRPNEVKEIESNTEGIYFLGLIGKENDRAVRCFAKSVHNSFCYKAKISRHDDKKSLNITRDDETKTCLDSYDDEEGDYIITIGDHINYRYEIISDLGKGSFGQAIKCFDHKTHEYVCIKIIKNKKKFYNQAFIEIRILEHITRNDSSGHSNIVKYYTNFIFRNHICMVFELLDMNLYELIKEQDFKGLDLPVIRKLSIQLLYTLLFMKKLHIIHCDLKPENILLKQWGKTGIKVIDFGSSCFEDEKLYTYIQSRFYRAPEIILGQGYGIEIDMWSFGCILCELFTGIPIFPGENERDQLYYIMEYLGVPSSDYLQISRKCSLFFDSNNEPYKVPNSRGKIRLPNTKSFYTFLQGSDENFIDFIQNCLQWNPEDRLKPEDALMHPWILFGMPKDILSFHKKNIELVNRQKSPPIQCENGTLPNETESKVCSSRDNTAASTYFNLKVVNSSGENRHKSLNLLQDKGSGPSSQVANRLSMDTESRKIKKNSSANLIPMDVVKPKKSLTLDIHINIKKGSDITVSNNQDHKNNLSATTKEKEMVSFIEIQEL